MDIIKVVYPSLDEYAERANAIAQRCGRASLLMLNENDIDNESERNEFSFIMKAVGDQLLHREWEAFASKPIDSINAVACPEPEPVSGSTFFAGVAFDCARLCRAY